MISAARRAPMEFLILESDPRNAELFRRVLRSAARGAVVNLFPSADQVLRFLQKVDLGTDLLRPELMIVSVPDGDSGGCTVIERVRRNYVLRLMPILVFTGSDETEHVERFYDLEANCCISRPRDPEELREVIRSSVDFWLSVASRPDPLQPY